MRYGRFDNQRREYVIERVDAPFSFSNYLGRGKLGAVVNQHAGGYLWAGSPQYGRVTRFRPNGVPMDGPGHYVYVRDNADGKYWSLSWQPVGVPLSDAKYECRHGFSYARYLSEANGIQGEQTLFIPLDDDCELWDVRLTNTGDTPRSLSVFGYCEFSFHNIDIDYQNFQMSLYCAGTRFKDGLVEYELKYEENTFEFFAMSGTPDSHDCLRDAFLGAYRTERNPLGVERGVLSGSEELGNNHCGALHKRVSLAPGETVRLRYLVGSGDATVGRALREKYDDRTTDAAFAALAAHWTEKLEQLQVKTPDADMDTSLNLWNLYQSQVNVTFSRFASFIEVGGRTGLGYRDTAQDAMCIPHADPAMCRLRIEQLLNGQVSAGYGLHLFDPAWFEQSENAEEKQNSPTVIPTAGSTRIHGVKDACADDALWLIPAIAEYVRETGELHFLNKRIPYADGGDVTVYEHMKKALDFSFAQVGAHGVCKGLRADWNDCLNLGGGESAMVSFLLLWAVDHFAETASALGQDADAADYAARAAAMGDVCHRELWDGAWWLRGITGKGMPIGSHTAAEGKVHLESNAWAVVSGAATQAQGESCMDAVRDYLYTPYGLMLNAPSFTTRDDSIGFVTRVYGGIKENGAIFSHANPWAWVAEAMLGRGDRAMELYMALLPEKQNDMMEIRQAEPYSYCQFIMGRDHTAHGRARHPFMTGSAGWSYYAATRYLLGVRPGFDNLTVDPCIPAAWNGFSMTRKWRGATYRIEVQNPEHICKGIAAITVDGQPAERIPRFEGGEHTVTVRMGRSGV
jgi:N,N'-diacetylchitobiose phosphorylase